MVRFWDGRQWTAQTAPALPPAPAYGVQSGSSLRDRWRGLRRRTKVLIVVGALVVFGALMPDEDVQPSAQGHETSAPSAGADASAEVVEADDQADGAVEDETEEPEEEVVEEIAVPALRSESVTDARSALRRAGLKVKIVRQMSWQPAGEVLKQGTKAGAALLAGQVVTLVVAAPMPRVPGVLGKGAAVGQAALSRAGFKVSIVKKVVSSGVNNMVLSQSPSASEQAAPGSVVRLVVSNVVAPPPPQPVPLVTNCTAGYQPCLTPASDYDCGGGSGDGPKYAYGPIYISGSDPYGLDNDGDGVACES